MNLSQLVVVTRIDYSHSEGYFSQCFLGAGWGVACGGQRSEGPTVVAPRVLTPEIKSNGVKAAQLQPPGKKWCYSMTNQSCQSCTGSMQINK